MRIKMTTLIPVLTLAILGGCASDPLGADVTRFHAAAPVSSGLVYLEPADPANAGTLEFETYRAAVAAALRQAGFGIADSAGAAELIGLVDYGQRSRVGGPERSPVTIGVGGGSFGRHVGVGVGGSFGVGAKRSNRVNANMLGLQLKRASDKTVVWEGRAVGEAGADSEYGSLSAAVPALAGALLRDFPGRSGQTVHYKF